MPTGTTPPTAADPQGWRFETKQVQAGHTPDAVTGARAIPIYQSTSFVFPDAAEAADRFALRSLGPIYTRLDNPTNQTVAARIAALEGGVGAHLVASGMGAETLTFLTLGGAGSSIVASPSLYGGTINLLTHTLPELGITTHFVEDPADPASWTAAADETTTCFFGESIPNPKGDILDIEPIAAAAHALGVPLVVDNTMASPYLTRPIEWGADIVVESATKFLGGHGSSVAGVIVDSGNFDYAAHPERFPGFNTPDPSYNGLVYARDLGVDGAMGANLAFILKAHTRGQRDFGFAASPFNAFLLAQGVETLSLRMERHVDNALAAARWLQDRPEVAEVRYSGLESSPYYDLHRRYCPRGAGSVFAFDLAGFEAYDVHMSDLIAGRHDLAQFQALVACGGFSYGDVLGAGAGWARTILFNPQLSDAFGAFFARPDTLTLGVCNGCQMLSHLKGLIPGAEGWPRFVRNRSEQYEGRFASVEILSSPSLWLSGMAGDRLPIVVSHGEGRADFSDVKAQGADGALSAEALTARIAAANPALQYIDGRGNATETYPLNPNGSPRGVTGFASADGRATIMMPHPERVFRLAQWSWKPRALQESGLDHSPWMRLWHNARRQFQ